MVPWENYQDEGIPEQLLMYRVVPDYPDHPQNPPLDEVPLVGIRNLYKDRNPEYWKQRTALETAYLEWRKAEAKVKTAPRMTAHSEWDGKGPCPTCKRLPQESVEGMAHDGLMELIRGLGEHGG